MTASWAPLTVSPHGVPEIEPAWVDANRDTLQIVDVREPHEFDGPLGHIAGARLLPLGSLSERISGLGTEKPVVAVCRSGARSAQAALFLQSAGFGNVANMTGGMLRWRAEGRAVEGGGS